MAPNHETKETDGANRHGHRAISENGFARKRGKNMRRHSHAGQYRDVNFGMSEKPEEVLPEKRSASAVGLQLILYPQTGGKEKARSGRTVKKEKNPAS